MHPSLPKKKTFPVKKGFHDFEKQKKKTGYLRVGGFIFKREGFSIILCAEIFCYLRYRPGKARTCGPKV